MIRITLIEDDPDLRHLLDAAMRNYGFSVQTFENGDRFLLTLTPSNTSDLYVIDLNLGGKSGFEVCTAIKKLNPSAIVILISANPEVEERAAEVSADDFMIKPFPQKELIEKILTFVKT